MCASVFSPVACLDAPKGLDAASTGYGQLYFLSVSLESISCHFSARSRVAHQASPNQTPIDKRRINTIFNHFRDKPARYQTLESNLY